MRRTMMILVAGALASVTMSGCWFFRGWDRSPEPVADRPSYDPYYEPSSTQITWQAVDTGDLGGHVVALEQEQGTAVYDGYSTSYELDVQRGATWSLFRLTAYSDLSSTDIQDGAVLTSATDGVDLMGCTGNEPYVYDFDGHTTDVTVTVNDQGDGTRVLSVVGTFLNGYGETVDVRAQLVVDLVDRGAIGSDPGGSTYQSGSGTWTDVSTDLAVPVQTQQTVGDFVVSDTYSQLTIDTQVDGRWIMFMVTTGQNLGSPDLEGAVLTSATDESLDVLGCVGPQPGSYDYDGHTQDVEVRILPGPTADERVIHVHATFPNGEVMDGNFSYLVQ
ncbi:MAG: hypothetical protein AB7S26_40650 [Sandaracinaceae bacterium]